jgi:hypothetical protein
MKKFRNAQVELEPQFTIHIPTDSIGEYQLVDGCSTTVKSTAILQGKYGTQPIIHWLQAIDRYVKCDLKDTVLGQSKFVYLYTTIWNRTSRLRNILLTIANGPMDECVQ